MKAQDIKTLNDNIIALTEQIAQLNQTLKNAPQPVFAMIASSPEVSNMVKMADLTSMELGGGMVIPLNVKAMKESGLDVSIDNGVNVVKIMKTHTEYMSSCFNEVHYNPKTNQLTVFFKNKGKASRRGYTYSNVDQDTYKEFVTARSLGRYYLENIKGCYRYN